MPDTFIFYHEIYRKILHFFYSFSYCLLLWYFGKDAVLPWFILIAVVLPLLDYSRRYVPMLSSLFFNLFYSFIRPVEHRALTGASWVVIGAALTTFIFNEEAAIIGLMVLSISDSVAAIVGIKFGKTQLFNKSLEGSSVFFISSLFIIFLLSPALFIIKFCAAFSATLAELFSTPFFFNDNLSIPLVTALILSLGGII